jgi:flagellin-like hook-associated protein FlgL
MASDDRKRMQKDEMAKGEEVFPRLQRLKAALEKALNDAQGQQERDKLQKELEEVLTAEKVFKVRHQ